MKPSSSRTRHLGITIIRRSNRRRKPGKGMSVVSLARLKADEVPLQSAAAYLASSSAALLLTRELP